jgi:thiol-disulfide isomerase/thioredoxin
MAKSMPADALLKKYCSGRELPYDCPDFGVFYNALFSGYVIRKNRLFPEPDLMKVVNVEKSAAVFDDLLGRDSLLRQAILRELVMLTTLKELAGIPDYSSDAIVSMLQQVIQRSRIVAHREIAGNLVRRLSALRAEQPAPDFSFLLPGDSVLSLAKMQGKYVYMGFFTSWCTDCLANMELMKSLQPKFADDVVFIMVSVDENPLDFQYFLQKNPWPFAVVHYAGNYDLLDDYAVRAYPLFVLIDRAGGLFNPRAKLPAEGIELEFRRLLK